MISNFYDKSSLKLCCNDFPISLINWCYIILETANKITGKSESAIKKFSVGT